MPFSVYSSSVNTGYGATISRELGLSQNSGPRKKIGGIGEKLYWIDDDTSSTIVIYSGSINPSGSSGPIYTNTNAEQAFGISIDNVNNKVYWTELEDTSSPYNPVFKKCDLDGDNVETVFTPPATRKVRRMCMVPKANRIIYSTIHDLYTCSLDGDLDGIIFDSGAGTTYYGENFTYSPATEKIYARYNLGGIKEWNIDGTGEDWIGGVQSYSDEGKNSFSCEGMACDNVNEKLYWTFYNEGAEGWLYSSSMDPTSAADTGLISSSTNNDFQYLTQPVVDPVAGKLYTPNAFSTPVMWQSDLDGGNAEIFAGPDNGRVWGTDILFTGDETTPPGFDITNLHEDTYGGIKDAPMQGPFTYQYVGGNQHRHVPLNTGSDSAINRPELFRINITSSGEIRVVGPNSGSTLYPRAIRTRGEVAKRSVNIANHRTYNPLGNYSSSYEIVQTTGRTSNNRSFVEAEGVGFIGDPNLPYSGSLVTQHVRPTTIAQFGFPGFVPPAGGYDNKKCLSIDGESSTNGSYLELVGATAAGNLNWTPTSDDFTISAWFKMEPGTTGTNYIVSKMDSLGPTIQYAIRVDGSGNISADAGDVGLAATTVGTDYRDGEWHNVILDNTTSLLLLYVDGGAAALGTPGSDTVATDPLIGAGFSSTTPTSMFSGQIDEVSFWDTLFNTSMVTELYNGGVPADLTSHSAYANLATWLRMGDGTGDTLATITDQGPDGNDATLKNVGTPPTPAALQELIPEVDSIYFAGATTNLRPYTQNYAPDRTLPVFTPQETVFVNRFNAPGGPDVSSRGVLDTYAEEMAPNNAMPWRNNAVRSVLRTDLATHNGPAGIGPNYTYQGTRAQGLIYNELNGDDVFQVNLMNDGMPSPNPPIKLVNGGADYYGLALDNIHKKWYLMLQSSGQIKSGSLGGLQIDYGKVADTDIDGNSRGMDASGRWNRIVWVNKVTDTIVTGALRGLNHDVGVIAEGDGAFPLNWRHPYAVAFDNNSGRIYAACLEETSFNEIVSCSIDGSNVGPLGPISDLIVGQTERASLGIDVDEENNKLYIVGEEPGASTPETQISKIYNCNLDGTDPRLLFTHKSSESDGTPRDIQVDPYGDRMYVAFLSDDAIFSCSLSNPGTGSENFWGPVVSDDQTLRCALIMDPRSWVGEPTPHHQDNRNTKYQRLTPPTASLWETGSIFIPANAHGLPADHTPYEIQASSKLKRIYWLDRQNCLVRSCDMGGNDLRVEAQSYFGTSGFSYLELDEDNKRCFIMNTDATYDPQILVAPLGVWESEYPTASPVSASTLLREPDFGGGLSSTQLWYHMAYDSINTKLYWTSIDVVGTTSNINCVDANGYNPHVIISKSGVASMCLGLALDEQSGILYYSDYGNGEIRAVNTDGTNDILVHSGSTHHPYKLALDLRLGKLYAQCNSATDNASLGDNPRLVRMNLDGSNFETILNGVPFGAPTSYGYRSFAVDAESNTMYFSEAAVNDAGTSIYRCNTPEKAVYDNGFVTHAIPQCSLQYSWIKASAITDRTQLLGYQNSGSY